MKKLLSLCFLAAAMSLTSCQTTKSCCGKDGKCCKPAAACCGKDGKCCKTGHKH